MGDDKKIIDTHIPITWIISSLTVIICSIVTLAISITNQAQSITNRMDLIINRVSDVQEHLRVTDVKMDKLDVKIEQQWRDSIDSNAVANSRLTIIERQNNIPTHKNSYSKPSSDDVFGGH